jgi:hypothetical protein
MHVARTVMEEGKGKLLTEEKSKQSKEIKTTKYYSA